MYFVNNRKKLSFSFLTFIIVLLSIVSITFGTISSSANSAANEKKQEEKSSASDLQGKQIFSSPKEAKPFSFLSNHLTTFFNGNNIGQTSLISHSSQSKENAIADSPVFNQFNAWISLYISNGLTANSEQMNFGEDLAVKRKQLLKELIQLNPKAALEKAIPAETFNRLPSFITENSEKRISAYGDFNVYILDERDPLTGKMTGSRIEREVIIGDSRYKAFVYGRREAMTTKLNIPLQGIVIDDIMVVDESPLRKMDSAEYAERAVDESALGADGIAAEVGGKVVYFSNQSELSNFAAEQIEWESKIGPVRPEKNLAPEEPASAWTEGAKTVLFMRVDFSDRPGEPTDYNNQPLTLSRAQNLFTNEVNPFYMNNSYNKTSLQATVTPVLRLPQTQVYYTTGSNYNIMITDARNAASQAGYNTNNFNLDIVGFSYTTRLGWVGLASIGAKGNLLNGAFYMQETSHELGHNYGLLHANVWRTTDGTIIGQGNNDEYGDCFDVMGRCYNESQSLHFNTRYKRLLDWLTDANVQTVTSNGIYRIVAQDSSSPGGIRTLKIRKDDIKNYWIEFRQLSPFASNGALLRWDYLRGNLPETQLLDMKPNTTGYFDSDSALLIGQSFYDSISQIRITVIGKGNTNPESLDVMVELGQSTGGCTYTLSPTSANIGVSGGTGSVNITAPSGCSWTASANQTFVTITSGSSGSSNGTINYSVAANTGSARSATITIAGQIFTIQQAGATIGSYTLVASPITIAPGGQLAVSFTAPGGSSLLDWVALYRVGALNTEYLDGGYTNGATSGTFNLTAPTQPGQYEFRYLLNNTFTSVVTSNTITVQSTPTPSPTPTPPPTPSPTPSSEVTSVGMSPSVLNLQVGASSQIQATARGANGQVISGVPFLWSSRNASIASVDQSGNVTGVSPGTTTIIATTPNGTHNPATVTVTPATPTPTPTPIPAGTAFITSKQLGTPRNDYSAWFGMKVTIGSQPITVRSLGRIFLMGNSGTHTVKIVRASDSVDLASALVSMTGGISGEFKYADLTTPVTLQANTVYYIASQEAQGGDAWCDDQTTFVTSTSAANVDGRAYNFGGGWSSGGAVQGNVLIPVDFRYDTASALTLMPSPTTIKVDSGILIKALTGWFNNTYNISGNNMYDYPSTATPGFADNPPLSVLRGVRFNSGAVEYDTTGLSPGTTYKVVI